MKTLDNEIEIPNQNRSSKSFWWKLLNYPYWYKISGLFIKRTFKIPPDQCIMVEFSLVTNPVYPYAVIDCSKLK